MVSALLAYGSPADHTPKTIRAQRADQPPTLDGRLDEPQWQAAESVTDFTQFDPEEGTPPTEKTTVRILYDDHAMYVGVMCYDARPAGIVEQLSRRDRYTEADRFTVMIDSYDDQQNAFVFSTNVSGVETDGKYTQGGSQYDVSWDAVWSVQTRRGAYGWSAEFEIPFDVLRFAVADDGSTSWGINFRRYVSRKKETLEWVMVPRTAMFAIPLWGRVEGIRDVRPPLHMEVLPYISTRRTANTGRVLSATPPGSAVDAGFDLKYGLSRNFMLDLSVNPDFGQVEVDQAVLNLTVFETRFPEKRPFFLEASQMFTFGAGVDNSPLSLFFSRRIGRQPAGAPYIYAPDGGSVEENPQVTTILGAAKLTGRTASGFSLGLISSLTDEEEAVVHDAANVPTSIRTEPRGSYNVVRLKQDIGGSSWIGGMATLTSRQNMMPAVTGGVDWNVRLAEDRYTLDGYVAGSRAMEDDRLVDGAAGRVLLSRITAEHWFPTIVYELFSPRFSINDAGFFAQPHDHGGYFQLWYRENFANGIFRRYAIDIMPEYRWNWDGVMTQASVRTDAAAEFTNFWTAQLSYTRLFPAYDDAERGILGTYRRPAGQLTALSVGSDQRASVVAQLLAGYEWNEKEKRNAWASLGLTVRPSSWMELNPTISYQRTTKEEAWVLGTAPLADPSVSSEPFSIFGDRDIESLDLALRGTLTFARTLSLQFFTQVFLARGAYQHFRRLADATTLIEYNYPSHAWYYHPDFNTVTFNANVLLRWEYSRGSTVYLVWTQGRWDAISTYDRTLSRRFSDAFTLPREDVLLVKVNYRLPL
jgi:hypothetical protein